MPDDDRVSVPDVRLEYQVLADGHRVHVGVLDSRALADDLANHALRKGCAVEVQVRAVTMTRWQPSLTGPEREASDE